MPGPDLHNIVLSASTTLAPKNVSPILGSVLAVYYSLKINDCRLGDYKWYWLIFSRFWRPEAPTEGVSSLHALWRLWVSFLAPPAPACSTCVLADSSHLYLCLFTCPSPYGCVSFLVNNDKCYWCNPTSLIQDNHISRLLTISQRFFFHISPH